MDKAGTSPWPYRLLRPQEIAKLKESQSGILSGMESRTGPFGSTGKEWGYKGRDGLENCS